MPLPAPSSESDQGNIQRLSDMYLFHLFRGRERGQKFLADFILSIVEAEQPSRVEGCVATRLTKSGRTSCLESFYFITLNLLRSVGGIATGRDADPLFTLVQAMEMLTRTDFSDGRKECGLKICPACKLGFSKACTDARLEVWSLLPQWFCLEPEEDGELMDED